MVHFLRVQEEAKTNWMKGKPPVPLWLAGVYCVTSIGPLWHTARGLVRDRDVRWLWHALASLGSVLGNVWGVWTYKRRGKDRTLIAELKVKQNLGKYMSGHFRKQMKGLIWFVVAFGIFLFIVLILIALHFSELVEKSN
jgi:hypothetical protein